MTKVEDGLGRWESDSRRAEVARIAALPTGAAVVVVGTAAARGGYYAISWGWLGLLLGCLAAAALLLQRPRELSPLERATLASLAALVCWVALSSTWSRDVPQTILEIQRDLVYPLGFATLLLFGRRASSAHLLVGLWAAITAVCAYSLGTRLFPGDLGSFVAPAPYRPYRLSEPLGYWNGLGIFAVLGLLLALGLATAAPRLALRGIGGASLVVLLLTVFYTFSRGAWIALAAGVVVTSATASRRLWRITATLALAPLPALALLIGSRLDGLTGQRVSLERAAADGHELALLAVPVAAGTAAVAVLLGLAERRVQAGPRLRRAWLIALLALLACGLAAIFFRYGDPAALARKAYDAFQTRDAPSVATAPGLDERLFNLGSRGRVESWQVAWRNYERHPVLGSGAGSYEQFWVQHGPHYGKVRDAHSLYLETLSELGPVGLTLLVAAFAFPLLAVRRARGDALVPAALGAYAASLVHAGIDWDWELVAVTFAALALAGSLLRAGPPRPALELRPSVRVASAAASLAVAAFAGLGLIGNYAYDRSRAALEEGRTQAAARHAHRAIRWQPWAGGPWEALGRTQEARSDRAGARRSYLRAIERDPGNWLFWIDLARVTSGAERRRAHAEARRLNPQVLELEEAATTGPAEPAVSAVRAGAAARWAG